MRFEWGSNRNRKSLLFFYGWYWHKERFKMYEFYRDNSGFTINFWRFATSYSNEGASREKKMREIVYSAYRDSSEEKKEERLEAFRQEMLSKGETRYGK